MVKRSVILFFVLAVALSLVNVSAEGCVYDGKFGCVGVYSPYSTPGSSLPGVKQTTDESVVGSGSLVGFKPETEGNNLIKDIKDVPSSTPIGYSGPGTEVPDVEEGKPGVEGESRIKGLEEIQEEVEQGLVDNGLLEKRITPDKAVDIVMDMEAQVEAEDMKANKLARKAATREALRKAIKPLKETIKDAVEEDQNLKKQGIEGIDFECESIFRKIEKPDARPKLKSCEFILDEIEEYEDELSVIEEVGEQAAIAAGLLAAEKFAAQEESTEPVEEKSAEEIEREENIERHILPLYGRSDGQGISYFGYPSINFLAGLGNVALSYGTDENYYLINSEGAVAPLGGFGLTRGSKVKLSANAALLSQDKLNANLAANVRGTDDVKADLSLGKDGLLDLELETDEHAEEGEQDVVLEIVDEDTGEVLREIPMKLDVGGERPAGGGVQWGRFITSSIITILLLGGLIFLGKKGVSALLAKRKGGDGTAAQQQTQPTSPTPPPAAQAQQLAQQPQQQTTSQYPTVASQGMYFPNQPAQQQQGQ